MVAENLNVNKMKKIFIKWIIFMNIFSFILSLFGCRQSPVKPNEELTSISISQNHMDRTYCYSFNVQKKNNTYSLSAWYMLERGDNDYEDIELENVRITEEEFAQFEELDKKYDFFSLLKPNKEKKNLFFVADETITIFSVSYGDESFSLYTGNDCYNEVYDCFVAITKKHSAVNNSK